MLDPLGRVAALYDVHGNLPALEAVLDDVRAANVDAIVIGGDVLPGPMPRETIARLRALDVPVYALRGNGDRAVLEQRAGREQARLPEPVRAVIRWTARQLAPADVDWLASWPPVVRLDVRDIGPVLFCHATPRDDEEIFTRRTLEAPLLPIFDEVDASLVVCGHTHMPFDRTIGHLRVVNAGSVGMPFGAPGADWLLLGPGVTPRRSTYDLVAAAERVRGGDYPDAADFAARHILAPPSEPAMLDAFARVEIGRRP